MKIYLASALGFAESTIRFMADVEEACEAAGVEVLNPWRLTAELAKEMEEADAIRDRARHIAALAAVNHRIGQMNEGAIRECDAVVAVLDGADVDSGTASEVGFAYGVGKVIVGLRTDSRPAGDNAATVVNLQVAYWIAASGGTIARSLGTLQRELRARLRS